MIESLNHKNCIQNKLENGDCCLKNILNENSISSTSNKCTFVNQVSGKKCEKELNKILNLNGSNSSQTYCSWHTIVNSDNRNVDINFKQCTLEEKTEFLIQRIRRLQKRQLLNHLNQQLSSFVKYEQQRLNLGCQHPFILNREIINRNNLLSDSKYLSGISVEDKLKFFSHENFKSLPTSELVKLIKKIEAKKDLNSTQKPTISTSHQNDVQKNNQVKEPDSSVTSVKSENDSKITKCLSPVKTDTIKKQKINNKIIGHNSSIVVNRKNLIPKFTSDEIKQIYTTVGIMKMNLKHFENSYDSDATESSSGGESCDDTDECINNLTKHQDLDDITVYHTSLNQKITLKWTSERSAIASRWTWLQAQIADLEFKIRQQNEMYKQLRSSKGYISFYSNENQSSKSDSEPQSCVRTLPLKQMKKRKLVRSIFALTNAKSKISRYSTILCSCNSMINFSNSCVICNERYNYIQTIDTYSMPISERIALLDPTYHNVLSLPENISLGLHFSKLMKKEIVQKPSIKNIYKKKNMNQKLIASNEFSLKLSKELQKKKKSQAIISSTKLKKKYDSTSKHKHQLNNKKSIHRHPLKSKAKDKYGNSNCSGENYRHDSPLPSLFENGSLVSHTSTSFPKRRRSEQNAYDINNIVIPYSIASTTRVEKLQYKEIITPKWRIIEEDTTNKGNNLHETNNIQSINCEKKLRNSTKENFLTENDKFKNEIEETNLSNVSDISINNKSDSLEDLSDQIFTERHMKCEADEKKRFCTYLKGPFGNGTGRGRTIRQRTESFKTEFTSVESNNIDCSSQDSFTNLPINLNMSSSKAKSPNSDYLIFDEISNQSILNKSKSLSSSRKEDLSEEEIQVESIPYEKRNFPLSENEYKDLTLYLNEEEKKQLLKDSSNENDLSIVISTNGMSKITTPSVSFYNENLLDCDDNTNIDLEPK